MDRLFSLPRLLASVASCLAVAGLCLATPTRAQLAADRPGLGDGALTVNRGTVQAELGYAFNENDVNHHQLGQLLLRFGVTEAVELRGGVGSFVINESPVKNGYSGSSAGAKVSLFRNSVSALSAVAAVTLPTETGAYDTPDDRAQQEVKLAFAGALGDELLLSVNAGSRFFYSANAENDRSYEWLFIPTLSMNITPSVGAYVGYAGVYTGDTNGHWIESGITILRNADTQLDLNTGIRVGGGDALFVGAGLVHRL